MFSRAKKKHDATVGLELDAGSAAAVEAAVNGVPHAGRSGVQTLPPGAIRDGEVADSGAVADSLRELFSREGLPKQVRLGVANQHLVLRVLRVPPIEDPKQLQAAVRFVAQEQIPMPLESAVLAHQVVGASKGEEGKTQLDVAVVAARREMVEAQLEPLRKAGLDPVGVDLTAFGMIRALADPASGAAPAPAPPAEGPEQQAYVQATLYCSLGDVTNLAIARQRACLFARSAGFGVRQISDRLVEERGLQPEHADQWLVHTGLAQALEELEGDPEILAASRAALEGGVPRLADELRLSIDYYGAQEESVPVASVVLCGWGSAVPGLAERLGVELGREVEVRRPAALAALDAGVAGRLTVPFGLGLEE
jgi:type IV pilus assembly protein PilM